MLIDFLQKNIFFRKLIYKLGNSRAKVIIKEIEKELKNGDKILDIGSGVCNIAEILLKRNFKLIPLDIKNLSFVDGINPIIYDGEKIPFKDKEFDVALIITVLHHTPKSEKILEEAKRVAKKIIVLEDIYTNFFHKHLTFFLDSLVNLEFKNCPHSNKTDEKWKSLFKKLNLNLKKAKYKRIYLFFKNAYYFLTS